MEIKINGNEYLKIFNEEQNQVEKYFNKSINDITENEYHKYLVEKHPDKVEVIRK